MADFDFENPTFDPDGPGIVDDYSLDLPDAIMDPLPPRVQEELNTSGDNIQTLRGEIKEAELEAQKKRLVDTFYKEVNRAYGLRPDSIDYDQFRIDDDGKTLYWTPGDQKISISTTRGGVRFLALSTLASWYWVGGTDALRRSLGLTGYTRKGLSSSAVKALQQADKTLPSNLDKIELEDLPGIADSARQGAEQVESTLTTIDDQPIDTVWVTQARRELAGLEKAMTGIRDELANNLAKLTSIDDRKSEVGRHLAREHRKLTETDDTEMKREIRDRIRKLESVLSDIELERQARLEALSSTNRATLRSQINRIRETFRRLLHEDTTLAERIRTLFREQGITIASILTATGMAISTLVLALTGGGGSAPVPAPKQPDISGLKEWVKKHLHALGRALANLAGKAAAALPGIIGSIVSLLLSTLGKTATWLAENLWALVIAVGTLLLVAARDWLAR